MGVRSAVRSLFEVPPTATVTEAASLSADDLPDRKGVEWGQVSPLGASADNASTQQTRRTHLEELHDLYVSCAPVSISVNAISRAVTAGGMRIVPDDAQAGKNVAETPQVLAAKRLMSFTNPDQNLIQVVRGMATDLYIFGDAFLEVVYDGEEPVALYSLDAPSMTVKADEHGTVLGYEQWISSMKEPIQFEPHEIIHVRLDNPRGGLYGLSPVEQIQIPAAVYLFTMASLKEAARRGFPPRVHVDHAKDQRAVTQRWFDQYLVRILGPKNIGTPIMTSGGGSITELQPDKYLDWLTILRDLRDIVTGTLGAPPNKVNIVESGNLGGGTGEAQDKNWRTITVTPLQTLILEALNFQIIQRGFGITGWHLEFVEVDYRDSAVVDKIHVDRVRLGGWTVNRWRQEIGEPPVPGGDDAFVLDRGKFVFVRDMAQYSKAEIDQMEAPMVVAKAGAAPPEPEVPLDNPPPTPPAEQLVLAEFDRRFREAVLAEMSPNGGSNGHNGHSAP